MFVRYKDPTRNTRLKNCDYSTSGVYFVTICTHNRARRLALIRRGAACLTKPGKIVLKTWKELVARFPTIELDEFVVMPDHIHGIIALKKPGGAEPRRYACEAIPQPSLIEIMGALKSVSAKRINRAMGTSGTVWQRSFHDHIIRSGESLDKIRRYIHENPLRWSFKRDGVSTSPNPEYRKSDGA